MAAMTDLTKEKPMPKDHLLNLIEAVAHLSDAVKNMGERFEVTGIEITDGKNGHHFDDVIRASPSFAFSEGYPTVGAPPACQRDFRR